MALWIIGSTRSGKTTHLSNQFRDWVKQQLPNLPTLTPAILVFAANNDNRRNLADQLATSVQGSYPVISKTPLGFIADEVMLFWPLLFERLDLKAQFPLRLRPETEQDLATQLWKPKLDKYNISVAGVDEYRLVRRALDLLQLAGASGIQGEDIPSILSQGLPEQEWSNSLLSGYHPVDEDTYLWEYMSDLLLQWQKWCLERGLLSYGLIYELYWRYLLPDTQYQQQLKLRYQAVFADDVDDYPAIARDLFEFLLDCGTQGVFTYNREGKIRLGLGADPDYLAGLASRCRIKELESADYHQSSTFVTLKESLVQLVIDPAYITSLPTSIQSIQTTSRSQLLRQTAQIIIQAIQTGEVQPQDVAVIAPGLDEIARYTLREILTAAGIPVEPLNEQRPLVSSPLVRALLTMLTLVYPDLGRLVDRDSIAEMLVVLSTKWGEKEENEPVIDPVRAGLIADYCYFVDPQYPHLLSTESFPRWDRLGHQAKNVYEQIRKWLESLRKQQQKSSFTPAIAVLDQAIEEFFHKGSNLPYDHLAALRELSETAQHYWEVNRRLRQNEPFTGSPSATVGQFIQLLRRGTITANPRPFHPLNAEIPNAVTLATIFQYRSQRSFHRWQFWLDAGSALWDKGGAANLFGYPLFLHNWSGKTWTPEDEAKADEERLQRLVRDLLGRVGERLYLCHSDLSVNGTEQTGPLLTLVHASLIISSNN